MKTILTFAATVFFFGITFSQIPTDGLVAWYPFNGNANDESGNGIDGVVYGAVLTSDRFGQDSHAYLFNGVNNSIRIDTSFFDNGWNEYSVSAWFNCYNINKTRQCLLNTIPHNGLSIVYHYSQNTHTISFWKNSDPGIVAWNILANAQSEMQNFSQNQWYHLTFIKSSNVYKIYLNGIQDTTFSASVSPISYPCGIIIGSISAVASLEYFSGKLDDYRIYNRALTQAEITALYQEGNSFDISGTLTYDNAANTPLSCCTVLLKDTSGNVIDTTDTGTNGEYTFTGLQDGIYSLTATTAKTPGGINSLDALEALKHYTEFITLTGLRFLAADVNGNGYINSSDALVIAKRYTELILTFPIGNWVFEEPTFTLSGSPVVVNFKGLCTGDVNGSYVPPINCFKVCGDILFDDRDGKAYATVQIGSQCWMRDNLNIGSYIESTVASSPHSNGSNNGIIEKYCLDNNPLNCNSLGGLYDWDEMMGYSNVPGSQGICPPGWHIPTDNEWCILTTFADQSIDCGIYGWSGTDAGGKLKETGLSHWNPNIGATNESGFTAIGAGYRIFYGNFANLSEYGYFWSSTQYSTLNSIYRAVGSVRADLYRFHFSKTAGFSVRCLQNCMPPSQSNAGEDQSNIIGETTNLTANDPGPGEMGTWGIINGTGGSFTDIHNPATTFNGTTGSTYILQWQLTNGCGNSTADEVVISFYAAMGMPCPDMPSFEYGGQTYNTVQIGNQCWMKENLNVGTMINGTQNMTDNGIIEKYCYNNEPSNCDVYGGLYQWYEVMQYLVKPGKRGICPTGWHLPTVEEWCTLTTHIDPSVNCEANGLNGTDVGGKMKETGFFHWSTPNTGATNESGFSALGAGLRSESGNFLNQFQYSYFWSSDLYTSSWSSWGRLLAYNLSNISNDYWGRAAGLSVRCIKDSCTQSDAGQDQLNIIGTSVVLSANIPPQDETGTWTILSGNGGSFGDTHDPSTNFYGTAGTSYTLTWQLSNSCQSSDDILISFAAGPGQPCYNVSSFVYGHQTYHPVQIGTQCWIRENLNIGTMVVDDATGIAHTHTSNNGIIEKFCYDNDTVFCNIYGAYYDWDEMMQYSTLAGSQGICPSGWHLPTSGEWNVLINYLGGNSNAGGKMKEAGLFHWSSPNTGATNESGLTILGASGRGSGGGTHFIDLYNQYWSSSQTDAGNAADFYLYYNSSVINQSSDDKAYGFSVRCVRGEGTGCTPMPTPSDAGPDQNVTGTTTNLAGNTPLSGTGLWSIVSGTGGSVADPGNPLSTFSGVSGNTYTLVWTITTICAASTDTAQITFTSPSFTCGSPLNDTRDGQVYSTVQIGSQCWMQQNLNIGTMVMTTSTGSSHSNCSNNGIIEKYCYNNDPFKCSEFGGLYDWNEMMDYNSAPGELGICPLGWHLPTSEEWCTLLQFLDPTLTCYITQNSSAVGKLKETGYLHWNPPNTSATNESGFTALGSGQRDYTGYFTSINELASFWTSNEYTSTYSYYIGFTNNGLGLQQGNNYKTKGWGVRCIKNQ